MIFIKVERMKIEAEDMQLPQPTIEMPKKKISRLAFSVDAIMAKESSKQPNGEKSPKERKTNGSETLNKTNENAKISEKLHIQDSSKEHSSTPQISPKYPLFKPPPHPNIKFFNNNSHFLPYLLNFNNAFKKFNNFNIEGLLPSFRNQQRLHPNNQHNAYSTTTNFPSQYSRSYNNNSYNSPKSNYRKEAKESTDPKLITKSPNPTEDVVDNKYLNHNDKNTSEKLSEIKERLCDTSKKYPLNDSVHNESTPPSVSPEVDVMASKSDASDEDMKDEEEEYEDEEEVKEDDDSREDTRNNSFTKNKRFSPHQHQNHKKPYLSVHEAFKWSSGGLHYPWLSTGWCNYIIVCLYKPLIQ